MIASELPNSAIIVLSSLTSNGPMTPKSIIKKLKLPSRTVTFALRTLIDEKIVGLPCPGQQPRCAHRETGTERRAARKEGRHDSRKEDR